MQTLGKVVDASVLVGSAFVGFGAVKTIMAGAKSKSTSAILLGSITLLIGVYAFKEAMQKINE
jgi:hypothetical protein